MTSITDVPADPRQAGETPKHSSVNCENMRVERRPLVDEMSPFWSCHEAMDCGIYRITRAEHDVGAGY
jgi:hypothetical protein